jgi:hypothetical protein
VFAPAAVWYRAPVNVLHSDKYRSSLWDFALPIVAGFAIVQGLSGGGDLPLIIGVLAAFWSLYTRHSRYDLLAQALIIRYSFPRTTMVLLTDVHNVTVASQSYGAAALVLQRTGARSIVIKPADRATFLSHLNDAIGKKDALEE